MRNRLLLLFLIICCCVFSAKAQEEETAEVTATDSLDFPDYDPLKPSKAAFYSAVFPGLGQVYNKDYWKLPLVYGALGTGVGVIVFNDDLYQKYRTAYKERIAGRIDELPTEDVVRFGKDRPFSLRGHGRQDGLHHLFKRLILGLAGLNQAGQGP